MAAANVSTASLEPPLSPLEDYHHSEFDSFPERPFSALAKEPVFPLIQRIRAEIALATGSTVLSYAQLKEPNIDFSVVRPLIRKLCGRRPPAALLYGLIVNRAQFLADSESDLAYAGANTTHADLCELVAVKCLSAYRTTPSLELLHVISANFNPFEGAELDMFDDMEEKELEELRSWGKLQSANVLEFAVYSKAKRFVKSPIVQKLVNQIYTGEIIYRPEGGVHSLVADDFKPRPVVQIYNWLDQPFLDHARLRVPMIRSRIEFTTFSTIVALFLLAERTRNIERVTFWEALFVFWSLGFTLDEWASIKENGLGGYFSGVYNVMDSIFVAIFFAFLGLRIFGLSTGDLAKSELAFDTLALSGCILFPRLAISHLRGNVIFLALTAMVKEFVFFMALASLCASGFLCSLYILGIGSGKWGIGKIAWLMFKIWLGNSFLGFDAAQDFHPVFGPLLIVFFAILSQTLLLTILISLLSNTFTAVQANAETEILNQRALQTIERVKSDAMTSYSPPLNLVAFFVLFVLKPFLSPRMFHKTNVFMIRTFNLPLLLFLALSTRIQHRTNYYRTAASISLRTKQAWESLPVGILWEGAADDVGKIFEQRLTNAAVVVPSIDDDEEDAPDAAESVKSGKGKAPGMRSKSLPPKLANMAGSKPSPLAKLFSSMAGLRGEAPPAAEPETATKPKLGKGRVPEQEELPRSVVARLEAIEQALAILVGEITKGGAGVGEASRPPLTSLSGKIEESYADTD